MTATLLGHDDRTTDIVGGRVLVGVQLIDISRLSGDPIPLTTNGLITVAGQGPKDSNGAGKSSFIAALSLLSADDQWRLASGAPGAADLLFTAELAAQEGKWSNANRGYIIGVFADPGAQTPHELAGSALTVWIRINRKAPYIDLRWTEDVFVPTGHSDADRFEAVDRMWNQLAKRGARGDLHANRLAETLYGPHVRCVSFLSTSVRTSNTANLLAQPLNELRPERIFDAIATLTGLDRELEQERDLRSVEHARRLEVEQTRAEIERWQIEMAVVMRGIDARAAARGQLDLADTLWRGRCARYLVDGADLADSIQADLRGLAEQFDLRAEEIATLRQSLAELSAEDAIAGRCLEAEAALGRIDEELGRTDVGAVRLREQIEELSAQVVALDADASAADGRDLETATSELSARTEDLAQAQEELGAARHRLAVAHTDLTEAESGDAGAAAQLGLLRAAGIDAVGLLDTLDVAESQRSEWEPRLAPYAQAVVVHAAQLARAVEVLAELPGSVLITADDPTARTPSTDLPGTASDTLRLTGFLTALEDRAGGSFSDAEAGVVVVPGFADPLTGRDVRIAAAKSSVARRSEEVSAAEEAVSKASSRLATARARVEAAKSAGNAQLLRDRIEQLRAQAPGFAERAEQLRPLRERAFADLVAARAMQENTAERIDVVRRSIDVAEKTQSRNAEERAQLSERLAALDLAERQQQWGDTTDAARAYLVALDEAEAKRDEPEWATRAGLELESALRSCFPPGTDPTFVPSEIRRLQDMWSKSGPAQRAELFVPLRHAFRTYLRQTEDHDRAQADQINRQRSEREASLAEGQRGLTEASEAAAAHRSSLAQGIKARLARVAAEFDRLDLEYGGYGAGLDYPEPPPPSEPDQPWRWAVTPKWRRAEGKRMSPYDLRGNTALLDEKAVKLVCASALASGDDLPLVLILDELGRNLGKQHRREAVALFERIGRDRGVTVVGALQDDMERYAIDASGMYIKLRRHSDSQAYNDPPVIIGHEDNVARVELLEAWLTGMRAVS